MNKILMLFILPFLTDLAFAQNRFEIEYSHSDLNEEYKDWNDLNLRTYYQRWVFEADLKNHFDESAVVLGANYTFDYSTIWYQDFTATFGSNSKIVPAWVFFSEIHRKFLDSQALVAGLGVGYSQSESPYSDVYGLGEISYYFPEFFSLQAGVRTNRSTPGSVITHRYFGVLNFALPNRLEAFLKIDHGKEGYTVLGDLQFKNEFKSTIETAQVRYWISETRGLSLTGEFYQSTFFHRETITLGYLQNF